MPAWAQILIGAAGGIMLLWLALVAFFWWEQRRFGEKTNWREIARLVPDVIRLVRRLSTDKTVPRTTRLWLLALLAYLISPIDLIPDFIPVLGYADDAIIVAVVLRYTVIHAGLPAVERHWPGTPTGLRSLLRLAGLTKQPK
ncbi:YkvA family protein [Glaciibacter sp. 2TAF33]|uniref:YkvA family protein n=1 Tax=Glaciibacter sp. 2TAF33 TaxID=3233015 RepID=UPI003F8FBF07